VQHDGVLLNARRACCDAKRRTRHLRRSPQFELPVLQLRRAVLRFERRVRNEGIHVVGFDRLHAGLRERGRDVPVFPPTRGALWRRTLRRGQRGLAQLVGLRLEADGALRLCRVIRPRHLELLAGLVRLIPAVGDNRHAWEQGGEVRATFEHERVLDA